VWIRRAASIEDAGFVERLSRWYEQMINLAAIGPSCTHENGAESHDCWTAAVRGIETRPRVMENNESTSAGACILSAYLSTIVTS